MWPFLTGVCEPGEQSGSDLVTYPRLSPLMEWGARGAECLLLEIPHGPPRLMEVHHGHDVCQSSRTGRASQERTVCRPLPRIGEGIRAVAFVRDDDLSVARLGRL